LRGCILPSRHPAIPPSCRDKLGQQSVPDNDSRPQEEHSSPAILAKKREGQKQNAFSSIDRLYSWWKLRGFSVGKPERKHGKSSRRESGHGRKPSYRVSRPYTKKGAPIDFWGATLNFTRLVGWLDGWLAGWLDGIGAGWEEERRWLFWGLPGNTSCHQRARAGQLAGNGDGNGTGIGSGIGSGV